MKRLIATVLVIGVTVSVAQTPTEPMPQFHVDSQLVLLPISVLDRSGTAITHLEKGDLTVLEDGHEQPIVSLSSWDVPVSLGVIFDASRSMAKKIDYSRIGIQLLFAENGPSDEALLIDFSDQPRLNLDLTDSTEEITHAASSLIPKGATALYDAIYLGLHRMQKARNPRRILIVVTDCGENGSRYTFSELRSIAREADVEIYILGILDRNPDRWEQWGELKLRQLASETGGGFYGVYRRERLAQQIGLLNSAIRSQLLIGFRPAVSKSDSSWHRVQVDLKTSLKKAGYSVKSRAGYYVRK